MKQRAIRLKDTLQHIGFRSIALGLVILSITVSIAIYVGFRYYATEKEVLQQQGMLNAKESAAEYDRYLLTRVNVVALSGYTVDDMLSKGASIPELEKYLTDQSNYVIATLDPGTTGLYGYFNGVYLDGGGWVPPDDFVPTERLWYLETLASDQTVTIVDPYLDLQSGTVMLTISSLLRGGVNVIAMDVQLEPIQQIVDRIAASTEGSQAFVLNKNGTVVIHSDESQLGKNYLLEPDSPGGAASRKLLLDGETQFDLRTEEGNYSVYVEPLEGTWYSVSLINADVWYRPLQRTTLAFCVILLLVVVLLVMVFLRLSEKNLTLQNLHARIDQEEQRGEALQMLSETDRMTGLNDRVSGKRKVDELLSEGHIGMFVEIDIDHFKSINDSYGHQVGDQVILALADALRSTFRNNDVTMRLGGDEFGVFALGIDDRKMGESIIRRLFTRIEKIEIAELRGKPFCVSVGATLCFGIEQPCFDELYNRADSAMYASKKAVGNYLTFSA